MYIAIGLILLWIVIVVPAIRSRLPNEVYAHCGLAILLTMPVLSVAGVVQRPEILWMRYAGIALSVPTLVITVAALYALRSGIWCEAFWPGRPEDDEIVTTGIYGLVRHPTFLAAALWSATIAMLFPSAVNFAFAPVAIALFWGASVSEDAFNVRKFGARYRQYASRVPRWNIVSGILRCYSP